MKAQLILADAVSSHPDGTVSLLRGGIDHVTVPEGQPCIFKGGLAARFTAGASEVGRHEFKIKCVNEDGVGVGLEAAGNFEIRQLGGVSLGFSLELIFPRPGAYTFSVSVDRSELDTYTLHVRTGAPPLLKPEAGR
jgi:hypothetical protein